MKIAFDGVFEFDPDPGIVRVKYHYSADGSIELTEFTKTSRMLATDFQHHFTNRDERLMKDLAHQAAAKVLRDLETGNGD
jgi:hypothetical protein